MGRTAVHVVRGRFLRSTASTARQRSRAIKHFFALDRTWEHCSIHKKKELTAQFITGLNGLSGRVRAIAPRDSLARNETE